MKKARPTNPPAVSRERTLYLRRKRRRTHLVHACQIGFLVFFFAQWEISARLGWIDSFILSQPSRILETLRNMSQNHLMMHVGVTLYETLTGFVLGVLLGVAIAVVLWWSGFVSRVAEPYLVVLNSLPKIALGPVIIIVVGAGTEAIIFMALAISLIVTVLEMLAGFRATNPESIKMARTFGATKRQVFTKIVFPSNINTLFNSLKINIFTIHRFCCLLLATYFCVDRYVVAIKTTLNSIISYYLKMLRHVKVLRVMLARYVQ